MKCKIQKEENVCISSSHTANIYYAPGLFTYKEFFLFLVSFWNTSHLFLSALCTDSSWNLLKASEDLQYFMGKSFSFFLLENFEENWGKTFCGIPINRKFLLLFMDSKGLKGFKRTWRIQWNSLLEFSNKKIKLSLD